MPRFRPHTTIAANKVIRIWGEPDEVQEIFDDLEPDDQNDGELLNVQVKATTVRRYPGGPTFTRAAHVRTIDTDRGIAGGATPGQRFWVERVEGIGPLAEKKVRQYTFEGPVYALKRYCRDNLQVGDVLRTPGGRAIPIEAPEGGGGGLLPGGG